MISLGNIKYPFSQVHRNAQLKLLKGDITVHTDHLSIPEILGKYNYATSTSSQILHPKYPEVTLNTLYF